MISIDRVATEDSSEPLLTLKVKLSVSDVV